MNITKILIFVAMILGIVAAFYGLILGTDWAIHALGGSTPGTPYYLEFYLVRWWCFYYSD